MCLARGADACAGLIANDPYLRALAPYIQVLESPPELRDISSTRVRALMAQLRAVKREIIDLVPGDILGML